MRTIRTEPPAGHLRRRDDRRRRRLPLNTRIIIITYNNNNNNNNNQNTQYADSHRRTLPDLTACTVQADGGSRPRWRDRESFRSPGGKKSEENKNGPRRKRPNFRVKTFSFSELNTTRRSRDFYGLLGHYT